MEDAEYDELKRLQEEGIAMEAEARTFIEGVLGKIGEPDDPLQLLLADGVVLCNLLNAIKPGACKAPSPSANPVSQRRNIEWFLKAASELGVPPHHLFEVADLYDGKHMRGVLAAVHAVGLIAAEMPSYKGPDMGGFRTSQRRRSTNAEQADSILAARAAAAAEKEQSAAAAAAASAAQKAAAAEKQAAALAASRSPSAPPPASPPPSASPPAPPPPAAGPASSLPSFADKAAAAAAEAAAAEAAAAVAEAEARARRKAADEALAAAAAAEKAAAAARKLANDKAAAAAAANAAAGGAPPSFPSPSPAAPAAPPSAPPPSSAAAPTSAPPTSTPPASAPSASTPPTSTFEGGAGCYLTFSSDGQGTLGMRWSDGPVDGALAYFKPNKPVPRFKFTQNAGRSDIVRECGGPNKAKFFAGVAQFVKAARANDAELTHLRQEPARPVAIYFNDNQLNVVPLAMGSPFARLHEMESVAVLNESSAAFNCLTLERSQFLAVGNRDGAALAL
ncbi:hypothetical protein AB1Y20_004954 [Prymnesium parvum]|uniref:Calponin-homology (CH) domain-containing protein n=1 Tax=Prymnesium parvum TaxID=97485 RepID=A0AB34J560_PRYPA